MIENNFSINVKYTLTVKEAAQYSNIGENKLRNLAAANPNADWFVKNGNRLLIKRRQFEKFIDKTNAI